MQSTRICNLSLLAEASCIQYHGWNDPVISPFNSVNYYNSVRAQLGDAGKVDDSYRLFMVPGMLHCGGEPGPELFNPVSVLERWRQSNIAPGQMTAAARDHRLSQ